MTLKEAIEEAIDCAEIIKSDIYCREIEKQELDDVIAKLNSLMEIDETLLEKITRNNVDISYPEEGNIIIHLEHATDEQREEIAIKIADWMQENYPELAMLDMYN